jgi:FeS assembly protein IscX
MDDLLTWDDSYAIALELIKRYPDANLDEISLNNIFDWTICLPEFRDDPTLANEAILMAIYQEWFEEVNPV